MTAKKTTARKAPEPKAQEPEAQEPEAQEPEAQEPEAQEPEPATVSPAAFTMAQMMAGCLMMAAIILSVIVTVGVLFDGNDAPYSMLPAGYREQVGLSEPTTAAILGDIMADPTATPEFGRSPFAEPSSREPIILEVGCPDGTVEIATGPAPVDTVCVRGRVVDSRVVDSSSITNGGPAREPGRTRDGPFTTPYLDDPRFPPIYHYCTEDSAIVPATGECVHLDRLEQEPTGNRQPEPGPVGPPASYPPDTMPRSLPDTGQGQQP